MKYVNPEMEIVEFDASILTIALNSQDKTETGKTDGGVDMPNWGVGEF